MIRSSLVTLFALVGTMAFSSQSHAFACFLPTPVCAVITAATGVGLINAATSHQELKTMTFVDSPEMLQQIDARVVAEANGDYVLQMGRDWAPGYARIIERFNSGKVSGNLSLASLYNFDRKLFASLDRLQEMLAETVDAQTVNEVYGARLLADGTINWARYAALAVDANTIWSNRFYFRSAR